MLNTKYYVYAHINTATNVVFYVGKGFGEFMKIVKKSAKIHGNSFTYTLIESNDIK